MKQDTRKTKHIEKTVGKKECRVFFKKHSFFVVFLKERIKKEWQSKDNIS